MRTWWLACTIVALVPLTTAATSRAGKARKPAKGVVVPLPGPTPEDLALLALTADPALGKADRISGHEVRDVVAFTFDDGPHAKFTPVVLDALAAYDIPATFFIITRHLAGAAGQPARELVQRIKREGYSLASHTTNHAILRRPKPAKLALEIDESVRTLATVAAMPIGLFRAPFGALDKAGRDWLAKRGLTETFWSIDTRDWEAKDPIALRASVLTTILAQRGGVVLMHDIWPITIAVLPQILDDLEAENCRRLAAADPATPPIIPVSLHYFLRDQKQPRAIPEPVKARTDRYVAALPARCAKRPPYVPPPPLLPTAPARQRKRGRG